MTRPSASRRPTRSCSVRPSISRTAAKYRFVRPRRPKLRPDWPVQDAAEVQTSRLKGDINMRAVQLTAFGNPVDGLEYVDIPEPDAPGPNQVLIGVEFSPINPNDLMVAQGIYAFRPPLPTVIGNEGVCRVLAVGPEVESVKFV